MLTVQELLPLFTRYYDVITDNVEEPFVARAEFKSHNEQYVLVKAAHIADIDSNEFIFFATCDELSDIMLTEYHEKAWEQGQKMIEPYYGHKNSDVSLVVLADSVTNAAANIVKKLRHSASYKFGLFGYSNYRLVVIDCNNCTTLSNRNGRSLDIFINKYIKNYKKEVEEK